MITDTDFINFLRSSKLSKEKKNEIVDFINREIYIKENRKLKIEKIIKQNTLTWSERT